MQEENEEKRCSVSGKLCFTERAAGAVLNSFKHHHFGRSKKDQIPRRKYFCPSCGFYHLTHLTNHKARYMKSIIKWHKEFIGGKWFSVANAMHIPRIEHCKDGFYKLWSSSGKAVLHKRFRDAEKMALETAKKYHKLNKNICA